jgi:drug/metabolite transporter (DMT)-like permease
MIVLDEQIGWRTLAGGAMIMSGIAFIVVRRGNRTSSRGLVSPTEFEVDS